MESDKGKFQSLNYFDPSTGRDRSIIEILEANPILGDTHVNRQNTFDPETRATLNTTDHEMRIVTTRATRTRQSTFDKYFTEDHVNYGMFIYGNTGDFLEHYSLRQLFAIMMDQMSRMVEQIDIERT